MPPTIQLSGAPLPGAPQPSPPATDVDRRARRLAMLDRLADLNMEAAEIAGDQIRRRETDNPEGPHLALTRATRAVTHVIAVETRLLSGDKPAARSNPAVAADPRRRLLRQTLHEAAAIEPDRAERAQLRRLINDRIDEELAADPDLEIAIGEVLMIVSEDLNLRIDVSQLSDELLGMPPRPTRPFDDPGRAPTSWPTARTPPGPAPPNTASDRNLPQKAAR